MKDTQKAKLEAFVTRVAAQVVEAMESGTEWLSGWVDTGSHRKLSTPDLEPYQGTNQLFLYLIGVMEQLEPYASDGTFTGHVWGGYNTWLDKGFRVRKGEKSLYRPIRAYTFTVCDEHKSKCAKDCERRESRFGLKLLNAIFHVSQVEREDPEAEWPQVIEMVMGEFDGSLTDHFTERGVRFVTIDPDRAYFSPTEDHVNLPPIEAFKSEGQYNGTVCHEVTHWSGHESRLNRTKGKSFGDANYATEELVAELGAMMLLSELGLEMEPSANHAAYLGSWIKALKADPQVLFEAAKEAAKATEYLVELERVTVAA